MRLVLLLSLLIFSLVCSAEIYMSKDKDGNVMYSDTPSQDAKKIVLPESNIPSTSTSTPPPPTTTAVEKIVKTTETTAQNVPYTKFVIGVPPDKETITNQPTISVVFLIDPDLQKGDRIQLYLDGAAVQAPAAKTSFDLTNVERGTHQLSAILLDANNNTLKESQTVTIYVHYAHLGTQGG
jgi:hypothetical protein